MKPILVRGAVILASAVFLSTLWPAPLEAQRRAVARPGPRPGPRTTVVVGAYYRPVYYRGYYPYYYGAWYPYGGFAWSAPYGPWAPYGWPGAYPYLQGGYIEGSVRVQVPQREAEVFVDGYYAGRVDQFDGTLQRLRLEPGEHEIAVYLAGHRPWTQRVYVQPGGTFNIRETLEPLGPGEAETPRPAPIQRSAQTQRTARRDPRVPAGREPRPPARSESGEVRSEFAAVTFQVQPADAEILIDGERWQGPRADEALVVQLAPGRHQIEVRKDGYRTFTSEIDVAAGQSLPLNVSLSR